MEPKNRFILPLIGLFAPLAFYFILGSIIAPYLSALGISNDPLLILLGVLYFIVISYSYHEGKSQTKFLQKKHQKSQVSDEQMSDESDIIPENTLGATSKRLGTSFFINVFANLIAIFIWVYSSDSLVFGVSSAVGVVNFWYSIVVLIVLMFICSNIFRVFASIMLFRITIGTTLNSIKFILLEELIIYGLLSAYFLTLGGFFF